MLASNLASMQTKTIPGVELVKVGRWAASTGVTEVTRQDLDSIVAAYADQGVDRPAIKIGHTDQRFAAEGDGEPAYGWVANPRVSEDGTTLVGDLVGIPAKLAEVIPAAFRRRSVEIAWGLKTTAGKTYRAALTGLALLGIAKPAVKGMEDVLALYAEADRPADGITAVEQVDGLGVAELATLAAARVEVAKLAAAHNVPEQVLVDSLDRIDRLSGVRDTASIPQAVDEPADGTGSGTPAGAGSPTTKTKEEPHMALSEARVRELLKLEADADVETALKGLLEGNGSEGTGTPTDPPNQPEGSQGQGAPAEPPNGTPAPADGTPATVTLSQGQLDQLLAQAKAGEDAATELARQRRDKIVATALSEGRITPAEQKTWRDELDKNEAGTVTLLSSLAKGRVPVTEIGFDADKSAFGAGGQGPDQTVWDKDALDMFGVDFSGGK
jgi:hypothetical protein